MEGIKKLVQGAKDTSHQESANQQYSSNTGKDLRQEPLTASAGVNVYDKTGAVGGRDSGLAGTQPTGVYTTGTGASDYSSGQGLSSGTGAYSGGGLGNTGAVGGLGNTGGFGSSGQEAGYPGSDAAGYGGGQQGYNETGSSYNTTGHNNEREGGVLDKVKGTARNVFGRGHSNEESS